MYIYIYVHTDTHHGEGGGDPAETGVGSNPFDNAYGTDQTLRTSQLSSKSNHHPQNVLRYTRPANQSRPFSKKPQSLSVEAAQAYQ